MSAEAALRAARARGATLFVVGERVRVEAPAGALEPDLVAELRVHRDEIHQFLLGESVAPATSRMACSGCGGLMPAHPGGLCFACDLGVDRCAFPTRLLRYALQIRAARGPAGGRGVRLPLVREMAKRDAKARAKRRRIEAARA